MARSLGAITVDLLLKYGGFVAGWNQAAAESKKGAEKIQRNFTSAASQIDKTFTNLRRQFLGVFAGYASVATVKQIISIADEYKRLENRLRLVTKSSAELKSVEDQLFGVAQRTRSEFGGVVDLYSKLALVGDDLGASQRDLVKFTEAVGNALAVSGTSAQTARGALTQLAQGLAAGTFRAEEFNAVLEGAPQIIRVVAKNIERFHGSVGQLRLEVAASKLGSREFFEAFLKGSDELKRQAQGLPLTIAQSLQQIENAFQRAVGSADLTPINDSLKELTKQLTDPAVQKAITDWVNLFIKLAVALTRVAFVAGKTIGVLSQFKILTLPFRIIGDIQDRFGDVAPLPKGPTARFSAGAPKALPVVAPPGKNVKSEADNAREAILKQIEALEQQREAIGKTAEEVIRYRLEQGDLAEVFKKAGPAFDKYKQQFIDLTLAIEKGQAGEKVKDTIKAIDDQLVELRANRIEQTEGAAAALAYRQQYDDLAETFLKAGVSIDEYRERQRELIAEQATDTIEAVITDLQKQIDAIKLLRIEQEQGAEAAIRYRIAHGDLAQAFKDSGQSIEEYVAEVVKLRKELDGYAQEQAELDASYNIIPDRTKALKEYDDALKGLQRRLAEHNISLDEYNTGVKIAAKNLKEATQAIDEMSVFARRAAENLQDALADFLADPFKDGLDGMLKNFADTLVKMSAQIVAANLAEKFHFEDWFKGGGLLNWGDLIKKTTVPIAPGMPPATGAGGTLDPGLGAAVPALVGAGTTVSTAITAAGTTTATALTTAATTSTTALTTAISTATAALAEAGTAVAAAITTAGTAAAGAIAAAAAGGAAASGLEDIIVHATQMGSNPFPGGFAGGGPIRGPGTATSDSVPAWLSAGEFVVKAAAVQQPGVEALLQQLNQGAWRIPRLAQGGLVVPVAAPHYADGGRVLPAMGTVADKKAPFVVQQSITVNSPNGQVSRQTEMQITAAAARGARVADRHNN